MSSPNNSTAACWRPNLFENQSSNKKMRTKISLVTLICQKMLPSRPSDIKMMLKSMNLFTADVQNIHHKSLILLSFSFF